ncbi:hypothetical protein NM688_g6473 [Phlebia brevispora]|uniref:Uncharacterized protein n=1 Tax=Phlebia brevispora TaxID=194682 RepID=A0ACC1SFV0_9APHY|nr:hypothetical protein NM688_g6473 [Phlebia brevispora]
MFLPRPLINPDMLSTTIAVDKGRPSSLSNSGRPVGPLSMMISMYVPSADPIISQFLPNFRCICSKTSLHMPFSSSEGVEDIEVFDPSLWINQNKLYPRNPPLSVAEARNLTRFLKIWLPAQSEYGLPYKVDLWFSKEPPITDPAILLMRPIPATRTLHLLHAISGQKWFDGCQSICDPRYNGGAERFPLGVVEFWKSLAQIKDQQRGWHETVSWILELVSKPATTDAFNIRHLALYTQSLLSQLPWNAKVKLYNITTTTADLSRLIGMRSLSDTNLDMILAFLNCTLSSHLNRSRAAAIGSIALMQEMLRGANAKNFSTTHALRTLEARVTAKPESTRLCDLYVPAFVNSGHWIMVHVDFVEGIIEYGDSLNLRQQVTRELQAVEAWLYSFLRRKFKLRGNTLPHGNQNDMHSCGLFAVNMVLHALQGTKLLKHADVPFQRLRWFTTFIDQYLEVDTQPSFEVPLELTAGMPNCQDGPAPDSAHSDVVVPTPIADVAAPASVSLRLFPIFETHSTGSAQSSVPVKRHATSKISANDTKACKRAKMSLPSTPSPAPPVDMQGQGRSAVSERNRRNAWKDGVFKVSVVDLAEWRNGIIQIDSGAEFKPNNPVEVKCSRCHHFIKVRCPYDKYRYKVHFDKCKGARILTLDKMAQSYSFSLSDIMPRSCDNPLAPTRKPLRQLEKRPCPGLSPKDDVRIATYLMRTGALGGGSRSLPSLAEERYGRTYGELTKQEKAIIDDHYVALFQWRNEQRRSRVYSTTCLKHIKCEYEGDAQPCSKCLRLLKNTDFIRALNRDIADEDKMKYMNKRYQDPALGDLFIKTSGLRELVQARDSGSPYVRYALGVVDGTYKDNKVLSGLMRSQLTLVDKEARGVGKQNFHWPEAYDRFLHVLFLESPAAYRELSKYLPARSERSFQMLESKATAFPMIIGDEMLDLVKARLNELNYTGPVALACDDTKLVPAWRLWWCASEAAYYLIGAVSGPLRVSDPEALQKTIDDAHAVQATKVRVYTLQVPLPSLAPIIIAALPISDSMSGAALYNLTQPILYGLLKRGIHITSIASDGAQIERVHQRLVKSQAPSRRTFSIPGPRSLESLTLRVEVAIIEEHPIVQVQDALHGCKTARNNLFSGARLLTFGNYTMTFRQIREMLDNADCPLYRRDVLNSEKQDDNAAARLFSASTLAHLLSHYPEAIGEIIFLYVFGELTDADQNRLLPHAKRLRMVLRAWYFVRMWQIYLRMCGYAESRYCISADALDIVRILVEGYFALLIIHRDYYCQEHPFPFLPWLHSTEPVEHTFGRARQNRADFTLMDLYDMMKKVRIQMAEAASLGKISDAKATASGYNHTYFDIRDIDLQALATYPSDSDITQIALDALEDAEALVTVLGIIPENLHSSQSALVQDHLLRENTDSELNWNDAESDYSSDDESELDEVDIATDLSRLICNEELHWDLERSLQQDEHILGLSLAAAALTLDDMLVDPDKEHEISEAEQHAVRAALASIQPADLPLAPQLEGTRHFGGPLNPLSDCDNLDLTYLVEDRRAHETRRTSESVRRGRESQLCQSETASLTQERVTETARVQLARRFYAALRNIQGPGGSVTKSRIARWCESPLGGEKAASSGNTVNAAVVASAAAKAVMKKRNQVFTNAKVAKALLPVLDTGKVSVVRPLKVGDFGFIFNEFGLAVGKVKALYTKAGGKAGRHADISDASTVGAISYVCVQVLEHRYLRQFGSIPKMMTQFWTKRYAHLSSNEFLCLLSTTPQPSNEGFSIGAADMEIFRQLQDAKECLGEARRLFRQRGKRARAVQEEDEEQD